MKRLVRALLFAGLVVGAAACVDPGVASEGFNPRNRNVITEEEVQAAHDANAYQLIQRLRPRWLQKRGARDLEDAGEIMVYFDTTRMGGPASLRNISLSDVRSVEFFNAASAQTRFGRGHENGAILIIAR